jgi:hypothetical protein
VVLPCSSNSQGKVLAAGKQCKQLLLKRSFTLALTLVDSAVVAVKSTSPAASAAVVANYYHRISTISTHSNRYSVGTRPYVTQWAKAKASTLRIKDRCFFTLPNILSRLSLHEP